MSIYRFGDLQADSILIQPVGEHELDGLEEEVLQIQKRTKQEFQMIAWKVEHWNQELSPWKAPAVFGNEPFGDGAKELLNDLLAFCSDHDKTYYLGGYSLAGLFALWASCQTDRFAGIAAASPSVWFPGFIEYLKETGTGSDSIYLSLGDREEKTKNPVLSTVGNCIREVDAWLRKTGINTMLEWNPGNHFREPERRTAKAFAWLLENRVNIYETQQRNR